ncbi:GTPase [Pengzhenrongella frigida]|uniref:GTP-binding protein HSR1 n=1 Tax=Pengzhenrongella frigida TaxID=1259133 RepID=A0A4Q5N2L9_9MICO|nr:GTPase [Cellulomonas sp. HLT2-17]RYV52365.1 GTP-binding protein HSR1 [Cellulomonas sp. HLT2-17]
MTTRGLDLAARVAALDEAVEAAVGRLPAVDLEPARRALIHARERLALSPDHTVVALAGSTGSGKSSLLNAIAGEQIAETGVRRPTTGFPAAAVWGADGAAELLDWLGVDERRHLAGPAAEAATGLVLIDLPDHDSVVVEHRVRAERLLERVDLFVWVADPQKYADAALHERYLQPLATHADVVVLALNQVDRLTPAERDRCVADLRRLAAEDGLAGGTVLAVSATTGEGLDELRELLRQAASRRVAATARLVADIRAEAAQIAAACGEGVPPRIRRAARDELVTAFETAAGVGVVVDAVRRSAARRARAATGWPPTRWLARFRPDPLRRLHLDGVPERPELTRSSLPGPGAAGRAQAGNAVREYTATATAGVPQVWSLAARARARAAAATLPDALDQAVTGTRLDAERVPLWWRAVGAIQWVLLAALAAGLLWLAGLVLLTYFRLPEPTTPVWFGLPAPTVLALGGAAAGILLALGARLTGTWGARRKAARARSRLRAAVGQVADERLVRPVSEEMRALERCRAASRLAAL